MSLVSNRTSSIFASGWLSRSVFLAVSALLGFRQARHKIIVGSMAKRRSAKLRPIPLQQIKQSMPSKFSTLIVYRT